MDLETLLLRGELPGALTCPYEPYHSLSIRLTVFLR